METIRELGLTNKVWLAATLAVLALGFATVTWEWRNAHTAASKHKTAATRHHHDLQSNTPETATTKKDE